MRITQKTNKKPPPKKKKKKKKTYSFDSVGGFGEVLKIWVTAVCFIQELIEVLVILGDALNLQHQNKHYINTQLILKGKAALLLPTRPHILVYI